MSYLFVYKHSNYLICCLFNRDAMFVLVHTTQCSNVLAFGNIFMFRHVAFYVQLDIFLKGINFLNVMYSFMDNKLYVSVPDTAGTKEL